MKNIIGKAIIIGMFFISLSSYSQLGFNQTEDPCGGITNPCDDVIDNELPIDNYVWIGLVAGVLVGITAYSIKNKKKQAA